MKTMKAKRAPKIPDNLLEKLRQRRGLDGADASKDSEIHKMSPAEMVREAVAWDLGYAEWADTIAEYMRDAKATPDDFKP